MKRHRTADETNDKGHIINFRTHQQRPRRDLKAEHYSKLKTADFVGRVTFTDVNGWRQKLFLSFSLAIRPLHEIGSEIDCRFFTEMEMVRVQVQVSESTLNSQPRPPQLSIRRVSILLEPKIKGYKEGLIEEEYMDGWIVKDHHPSSMFYKMLPSAKGHENMVGAKLQLGAMPNATLEVSRTSTHSAKMPALSSMINLEKSEFRATAFGGLRWNYEIIPKSQILGGVIQLESHRGKSEIPKSNPPSSFQAQVTAIFEIVKEKNSIANFSNSTVIKGLSIGYRYIKVVFKVDIHWCPERMAQFPGKQAGGHELNITHQFRDGREDSIPPVKSILEGLDTELRVEGVEYKRL
jgi:hypothetical protein